ncbi:ASCH domain-containing protein [Musicola keenii]|uniref:ASCH domain-containing protein n=1 Tax=Musicola keenii TaxID=2884250 RepID=UPI001CE2D9D4|nr:ASCH domain-containing protein [Musicola keenii]
MEQLTMNDEQQRFLACYLQTLTADERNAIPRILAEHFCADETHANLCADLILTGKKRASCSLKAAWEHDNQSLPQVGQLTVVLDWAQKPVCIIRMTEVCLCQFDQVTPEFAALEGEGDGSYLWWLKTHLTFFTDYATMSGVQFDTSSDLVLEYFERVYP